MITRRRLLLGVSATAVLAGCTPAETINWLPWVPPSPLPIRVPDGLAADLSAVRAEAQQLLTNGEKWKLTRRRLDGLGWFVGTIGQQARVLLSTDPARRQGAETPLPSASAAAPASAAAAQKTLTARLVRLQSTYRTAALATDGLPALLWAGLSAFSAAMVTGLPSGFAALGDDTTGSTPHLDGTTTGQVVALADQARYAYQEGLAAPGLSTEQQRPLRQRMAAWEQLRATILAAEPSAAPSSVPIGYNVEPASSLAQARALAVTVETAALPMFGAWLAGSGQTALRPVAVDALIAANRALVGFGGPALRWPGWPS